MDLMQAEGMCDPDKVLRIPQYHPEVGKVDLLSNVTIIDPAVGTAVAILALGGRPKEGRADGRGNV
jgi:hypothetical protein